MKRQNGRDTEKKTANVQMPRTVGVMWTCQPHFTPTKCRLRMELSWVHTNESLWLHACYPLSPSRALSNCARKMEKLHWIAVWVSFPRFRVSGIVFTCTQSPCFCQNTTYQARVVHSEVALWLTGMPELSRFVTSEAM